MVTDGFWVGIVFGYEGRIEFIFLARTAFVNLDRKLNRVGYFTKND